MRTFIAIFIIIVLIFFLVFLLGFQKKFTVLSNSGMDRNSEERINFLVLGKTGKIIGWNMSPDLADTIILVDYLPRLGAVNLISLPRDLYVTIGGESFKLNEILRRNRLKEFMADTLPEITGFKTEKYAVVDVDFVKKTVNEMGGIDIELSEPATDWVSGFTMRAGKHHLNGDDAVWLVRNRFAKEGDFYREKNQQKIIKAVLDKFKNMGLMDKFSFIYKMTPELSRLENNLDTRELMSLSGKMTGIRFNNIVLDFSTGLLQSASVLLEPPAPGVFEASSTASSTTSSAMYVLIPKEGQNNYAAIREFIRKNLEN